MKIETLITILGIFMSVILISLMWVVALKATNDQFIQFCADRNWEGLHNLTGDFSGEIDCKAMWENEFADGKWAKKCSDFPFSKKPSCKFLCVQDCMIFNKQAGEVRCVC